MKTLNQTKLRFTSLALAIALTPAIGLACEGAGKMTHMGNVLSVDASGKTFTIRDAQTSSPITFAANTEILEGLKNAKGSIMVNYEGKGDKLTAVGVTF